MAGPEDAVTGTFEINNIIGSYPTCTKVVMEFEGSIADYGYPDKVIEIDVTSNNPNMQFSAGYSDMVDYSNLAGHASTTLVLYDADGNELARREAVPVTDWDLSGLEMTYTGYSTD